MYQEFDDSFPTKNISDKAESNNISDVFNHVRVV